jgi:hypothetical protein
VLVAVVAALSVTSRWLIGLATLAAPAGIIVSVAALLFFIAPQPVPFLDRHPAERLVGWRDLAGQVERLRQDHGAGWIATADYGITGALAFYGPGPELVHQVDERRRYLFDTVDPSVAAAPALLVLPKERSDLRKFRRCFVAIEPVTEIRRPGPGGAVAEYKVWIATGARADILKRGCR